MDAKLIVYSKLIFHADHCGDRNVAKEYLAKSKEALLACRWLSADSVLVQELSELLTLVLTGLPTYVITAEREYTYSKQMFG
jgi:hypothetical protein